MIFATFHLFTRSETKMQKPEMRNMLSVGFINDDNDDKSIIVSVRWKARDVFPVPVLEVLCGDERGGG